MRLCAVFLLACVGAETPPTATEADCDQIALEWRGVYLELVSNDTCVVDEDCHVQGVSCSGAFGPGCWVAVSTAVTQDAIEEIYEGYRAEAGGVGCDVDSQCDCDSPSPAYCDGGHCDLPGPY